MNHVCTAGGTLVFGGVLLSFARPPDLKTLFEAFGMQWESGGYHRIEFGVNGASNTSITDKYGLVQRYNQKALHLQNMEACDAACLPTAPSYTQSAGFAPEPVGDRKQPCCVWAVWRGQAGLHRRCEH